MEHPSLQKVLNPGYSPEKTHLGFFTHPLNTCVTIAHNTSQWDLWEFIIIPSNTSVNPRNVLSWECLTEGYKIYDCFDPKFSSETPETPSHSVFLAEAHSEKTKQMPHAFSSTGTCKDLLPGTHGGRSQRHLVLDASQSRFILLVAGLAAMNINTISPCFVLPDWHCGFFYWRFQIWLLLVTFFISLWFSSQLKIRQVVKQKQPGKGWMGKWLKALANARDSQDSWGAIIIFDH